MWVFIFRTYSPPFLHSAIKDVYFSLKVPISYGVETHCGVIWTSGGGVVLVLFQNASHGSLSVKKCP